MWVATKKRQRRRPTDYFSLLPLPPLVIGCVTFAMFSFHRQVVKLRARADALHSFQPNTAQLSSFCRSSGTRPWQPLSLQLWHHKACLSLCTLGHQPQAKILQHGLRLRERLRVPHHLESAEKACLCLSLFVLSIANADQVLKTTGIRCSERNDHVNCFS